MTNCAELIVLLCAALSMRAQSRPAGRETVANNHTLASFLRIRG
jgi:hypothetical protein